MVKNERQRAVTLDALQRFEDSVNRLSNLVEDDYSPGLKQIEIQGMQTAISRLRAEIAEYDDLKSGRKKVQAASSIEDLPRMLIQTRIALGISQKELAQRIGMGKAQLEMAEEHDYGGASFDQIRKVISALGLDLAISLQVSGVGEEALAASR
jgi:ribosome-binding protein aMBF1 (putative translation factor)